MSTVPSNNEIPPERAGRKGLTPVNDAPEMPSDQAPARMASPTRDEDEKAAVDALVQEGIAREQAEELVQTHGTSHEEDHSETKRRDVLTEHHREGIPPYEPPDRSNA